MQLLPKPPSRGRKSGRTEAVRAMRIEKRRKGERDFQVPVTSCLFFRGPYKGRASVSKTNNQTWVCDIERSEDDDYLVSLMMMMTDE